jgi:ankyrin repeat protein
MPLLRTAACGVAEMCEVLLSSAESSVVNSLNSCGATALHVAAAHGHHAVIGVLCKHDAQLEMKMSTGETALHIAAFAGHVAAVRSLLESGADVNAVNRTGQPALQLAALRDHVAVLQLVLAHGADWTILDDLGTDAMSAAVISGKLHCVQLLVQHGVSLITLRHGGGQTLLMSAAADDRHAVAEWLLQQGLPVNPVGGSASATALHVAVDRGHVRTTKLLLEHALLLSSTIALSAEH